MVRVGRAQWRSQGSTGEAGNAREWPTPSNKKIRCRHHDHRSINRSSFTHRQPATDPPISRPTYPRDREVRLACLVGEPYVHVRYSVLRLPSRANNSTKEAKMAHRFLAEPQAIRTSRRVAGFRH